MQDSAKETFEFDPKKLLKVNIDKVRENSWNPKSRDTKEYKDVKRSIEINGLTQPIFVRENNNGESEYEVLDGAHRLRACKELGYKEIYIYNEGEVNDELAKTFTIWHQVQVPFLEKMLEPLAMELAELDFELPSTIVDIKTNDKPEVHDVEEVDIVEDEPPVSKRGELYKLGRHYLLCGDSTNAEDFRKLLGDKKVDLVMTDPPYNVAISNSQGMTIENDNMERNEFQNFLDSAFENISNALRPGGSFYVWYGDNEASAFNDTCNNHKMTVRENLIWVKNTFNLGRQDYQHRHESCLFGWLEGAAHYFVDLRNLSTVLDEPVDVDKMGKAEAQEMLKKILELPADVIYHDKPSRNSLHPCLPAGEKVFANGKWKNIETVQVGDTVEYGQVVGTSTHDADDIVEITTEAGTVRATSNHPFLILENGGIICWKAAGLIQKGDQVLQNKEVPQWKEKQPQKDTTESTTQLANVAKWNTSLSGNEPMDVQFQKGSKSTISTELRPIIALKTSCLSVPLHTSGYTKVADLQTDIGSDNVKLVENGSLVGQNTGTKLRAKKTQTKNGITQGQDAKNAPFVLLSSQSVLGVKKQDKTTKVYNLTIDGVPAFDTVVGISHNTMKPVPMIAKLIENSTEPDWTVLDAFGGSGTTLMACEQLGRTCYMIEYDPKYADAIRRRYQLLVTGSEEGWEEATNAE